MLLLNAQLFRIKVGRTVNPTARSPPAAPCPDAKSGSFHQDPTRHSKLIPLGYKHRIIPKSIIPRMWDYPSIAPSKVRTSPTKFTKANSAKTPGGWSAHRAQTSLLQLSSTNNAHILNAPNRPRSTSSTSTSSPNHRPTPNTPCGGNRHRLLNRFQAYPYPRPHLESVESQRTIFTESTNPSTLESL